MLSCIVTLIVTAIIAVVVVAVTLWSIKQFPNRTTTLDDIKYGFWQRYTGSDYPTADPTDAKAQARGADGIISYLERVIDRQINKARGILPFNAIILAVFSFEKTNIQGHDPVACFVNTLWLLLFAMLGLAISSALCLLLFLVRWSTASEYKYFHRELATTVDVILTRSKIIEWATVISFASLVVGAALVAAIEFIVSHKLPPH
jgi:hypothetical protein